MCLSLIQNNVRKILTALVLLCSFSAHAQLVFTVNSNADEVDSNINDGICQTAASTCTLRAAVMQANPALGLGVTIVLPAGSFVLSRDTGFGNEDSFGDLDLNTPIAGSPTITIRGAGASLTTIDANRIDRVLEVKVSRTATISDVTIRGGFKEGIGGGILNQGALTLRRVQITNNEAGSNESGGGVFNSQTLTLLDSTVSVNRAGSGAGIFNGQDLTIDRSTVTGNIAVLGGGIYSLHASTIRNSLITGNFARDGGGIAYEIWNLQYLINTTISGNVADIDGGGIIIASSAVNVYNTSVIGNSAGGSGGGIAVRSGATFGVRNSLIAGNTGGAAASPNDCAGVVSGYGTNMLGVTIGCSSNLGALSLVTRSTIGTLQNNGGPTLTHALLAGSQAINGAVSSACVDQNAQVLPTDQRGAPRLFGVRCDVGAFEFGSVVDLLFSNGFQ